MSKVAELAGISQSTVSRVVNDHPGISEETALRVRKAMHEVGYRPRPRGRARRLRSHRAEGVESMSAAALPTAADSATAASAPESLRTPSYLQPSPISHDEMATSEQSLGSCSGAVPGEWILDGQYPNPSDARQFGAESVARQDGVERSSAVSGSSFSGSRLSSGGRFRPAVAFSLVLLACSIASIAGVLGFWLAHTSSGVQPPSEPQKVAEGSSAGSAAIPLVSNSTGADSTAGPCATFVAGANCKWAGIDTTIAPGKELPKGPIQLVHGVAQLRFPNGAEALIEGPASLDLASGSGFFLWSGKLVAKVNKGELMVNTVAAVIGVGGGIETECAIVGEDAGWSEVHVLQGRVDIHPRKNNPEDRLVRRLQTGAAERYETFSRPGWKVIPLEVDRYLRSLTAYDDAKTVSYCDVVKGDRPLAYWRLSERSDARVADSSGNEISGVYKGMVALGQAAAMSRETDPSVFFQGGWVAVDDVPKLQFERDDAFSLEAWVRSSTKDIDMRPIGKIGIPGAGFCSGYSMFIRNNVLTFQATHRWHSSKHNVGILDGDVLDVPGTTIVTDGRWHHLVIAYDGSSKVAGVRMYVDGRPEAINYKDPYFSDTLTGSIRLGVKNLELARGGYAFATNSFMGAMDDVAIYDCVLTPDQVSRHFSTAQRASARNVVRTINSSVEKGTSVSSRDSSSRDSGAEESAGGIAQAAAKGG